VGKCRATLLRGAVPAIEEHVGAAQELALVLAHPMEFARIRCGGETDVDRVEVRERGAVCVVNGAMALVRDHEVEISVAETSWAKLAGDGVERANHDLAFETALATVEQCAGIVPEIIVERFLGLL